MCIAPLLLINVLSVENLVSLTDFLKLFSPGSWGMCVCVCARVCYVHVSTPRALITTQKRALFLLHSDYFGLKQLFKVTLLRHWSIKLKN